MPAAVLGIATACVVWVQRNALTTDALGTLLLLAIAYVCAAWVLWRPFRLRIADEVKEQGDALSIRRGTVRVQVHYSDVQSLEVLKIGVIIGAKLIFSKANSLGTEIGFFLNDPPEDSHGTDPAAHIQGRIGAVRRMPPNKSLERTRAR